MRDFERLLRSLEQEFQKFEEMFGHHHEQNPYEYQAPLTEQDLQTLLRQLSAEVIFQTKKAELAEKKVRELEARILENHLQQLKDRIKNPENNHSKPENRDEESYIQECLRLVLRKRSKQFHPDMTGGDAQIMSAINRAVYFLADPRTRRL